MSLSNRILKTDRAWLAGILDGEGSVILSLPPSHKGRHFCKVVLYNTDFGILNEIKRILDRWLIFYLFKEQPHSRLSKKSLFTVEVNRQLEASFLLEQLLPYLKSVKKQKAILFISFIKNKVRIDGKAPNYHKKLGQLAFPQEVQNSTLPV